MKINKIYISAFGGLKDFTLELSGGLNVIYGNNEDGKSTVAAFIKAMFFGTGKKTQSLSGSLRQKYTPWDGSVMAGRIFFEHQGKNYCLEREFRKSDSTDRILLTDTNLGKSVDTGENVGQRFFGMSAAAFERSLFIGTGGDFTKDNAAAGEINAKLSNIAVTGVEDISYQKIEKTLSDAKNRVISKTGRAGTYAEDFRVYEELKDRLLKADEDARKKAELNEIITQKRTEYEELYKQYTSLKDITDLENDLKNREKLIEYLETKKDLDNLNKTLQLNDGTTLDEAFVKKVNFGLSKYEKVAYRCDELQSDIDKINETIKIQNQNSPESAKQQIEQLNAKVEKLSAQKDELFEKENTLNDLVESTNQKLNESKNKKRGVNPILLIVSLLLCAATVASVFLTNKYVIIVTAVLAIISIVLDFVLRPQNKSLTTSLQNEITKLNADLADIKLQKNLLQEEINNANARINTLSSALNADSAIRAQRLADLNSKIEDLNKENEKKQTSLDEIFNFFSKLEELTSIDQIKARLADIEAKTDLQKQLKLQLSYLSKDLGNISYEQAAEKLSHMQDNQNLNTADIEKSKSELEVVTEKLADLKEKLTVVATELKTSFKNSENPEDLKRKINEYKERMSAKKEFCESVDTALAVLEESFYELRSGYGNELEKLTHSIFSDLTDGRYKNVSITDTLDISVEKSDVFGTRELDYLSLGTTHQAYLSLRLAIATLISENNPLPIFLDDSLSQYDDTRAARAMQFLKEFCKNGQGILFTCHNSICDIAENQGIKIQKPYN